MDELHMKKLLSTIKCAVCGQPYQEQELQVLGHRDEMWFLNVRCIKCGSRGMMAVVVKEHKEYQAITDLSPEERGKCHGAVSISSDDILDMHELLKDFDGDFTSFFAQK